MPQNNEVETLAVVAPTIEADAERDEATAELEQSLGIREEFRADTREGATWVLRKVKEARSYQSDAKAWATSEAKRAAQVEAYLLWKYGPQLEAFVENERAERRLRTKSVALPGGSLGWRKQSDKLQIEDEEAALLWCRAHCPDAIVIKESVSLPTLLRAFKENGELPDGCTYVAETEKFGPSISKETVPVPTLEATARRLAALPHVTDADTDERD